MEFNYEPKELRFSLEPPVVFHRIFVPCAILSAESSEQILTFLFDMQFLALLRFGLVFMFCLKKLVRFRIHLTSFFVLVK